MESEGGSVTSSLDHHQWGPATPLEQGSIPGGRAHIKAKIRANEKGHQAEERENKNNKMKTKIIRGDKGEPDKTIKRRSTTRL
ncbi:hypothetical protein H6P81_003437 [Aristolochia fimbriata]|uniref:Uncharacterized protein n=1 Tax=Aristolochia fimbriata TaxID=158543 RepID=A0AAV7FEB6_ARIFI|nr:hypothetical protein H6P81_003437 [Aristolochia fimbriata]